MRDSKYSKKVDTQKALEVMSDVQSPSEMIILEVLQDYTNSLLENTDVKVLTNVFKDVIQLIKDSVGNKLKNISKVVYYLEIEQTSIPHMDLVVFRFLIIGNRMEDLEKKIREDVKQFVVKNIGGRVYVEFRKKNVVSDILPELFPVRSVFYTIVSDKSKLRKYYSDDLYRYSMNPIGYVNIEKKH
jgi:hypothetical protein